MELEMTAVEDDEPRGGAPMMLPGGDPPIWWALLVGGVSIGLLSLITVIALGVYG